ncbi:MAG TPA: hypothetical protein VFU46_07265 [Gemmatimonadales bacterium]|nr:hypothetical protein [Gemmatimonadales bacterium]
MSSDLQLSPRSRRVPGLDYHPAIACGHLAAADPELGRLIGLVGACSLRPRRALSLFQALLRSIVYQQLNGRAAETILTRVLDLYGSRYPAPAELLGTSDEALQGAGLSRNKLTSIRDLARHALDGTVPSSGAARALTDDELVERLTVVRGVGRWTVEMLLIFRLGRADVFPLDDLGVRKGFRRAFGMRRLPATITMVRRAERWRPYRSVASWYLWRAAEFD